MTILGISAFYHDSAAAIIQDGEIIAAAQEERFSGKSMMILFPLRPFVFALILQGEILTKLMPSLFMINLF